MSTGAELPSSTPLTAFLVSVPGPFGEANGALEQMTARLNRVAPRHHGTQAQEERSERRWWYAGIAAAVLFLIVSALINGIAYWKLSEEQQVLALSLTKSSSATHHLVPNYRPASSEEDAPSALAPNRRAR
jgi:hypothetical protein